MIVNIYLPEEEMNELKSIWKIARVVGLLTIGFMVNSLIIVISLLWRALQ